MNVNYNNIPNDLQPYKQWICWRYEQIEGRDKLAKVPYVPFNLKRKSDTLNPKLWSTYKQACYQHRQGLCDGVGFVLTQADKFVAIDLDNVFENSATKQRAIDIVRLFGSYTERSPSGNGIRIFIKADMQVFRQSKGIEVYSYNQYVTVTGNAKFPQPVLSCQEKLEEFMSLYFPTKLDIKPQVIFDHKPIDTDMMPPEDLAIWRKAWSSKNGDKLYAQYQGNWQHESGDKSLGDYSFLQSLCYWTNGNAQQMKRMALQSGMRREKWSSERNDGQTWLEMEINKVIAERKAKLAA